MNVGYARHNMAQTLEQQFLALETFGVEKIITANNEKMQLNALLAEMNPDDCLVVSHLSSLGHSTRQLASFTEQLQHQRLHFISLAEAIDTRNVHGEIYLQMMQALSLMECDLIKERTIHGLDEARKRGKVGGRPKIDPKIVKKIRQLHFEKKETIQFIANKCHVSVGTCYKYINLSDEAVAQLLG
ncbi:recombinase family protein [Enterococcus timonensis]|uniref:recombinase family protein n=1 Tax=Enterococcus timonensis TaxID=1852364 RepID=UPI0008D92386|nr:recombinase family protein [Enterococcus timonensis]